MRLEIRAGQELCQVDLARDARIRRRERSEVGPVLALEELAADKVLALFARAEARDFVDVRALAERFGWDCLLALAAGFELSYFLGALVAFDRLPAAEFPLSADEYLQPREEVHAWRRQLTRRADQRPVEKPFVPHVSASGIERHSEEINGKQWQLVPLAK